MFSANPEVSGASTRSVALWLAVASLAYCYTLLVESVWAPLWCLSLDAARALPGEYAPMTGSYWAVDPSQQCWTGVHLAAVLVAMLLGLPLVTATFLWPLHFCRAGSNGQVSQVLRQPYRQQVWWWLLALQVHRRVGMWEVPSHQLQA